MTDMNADDEERFCEAIYPFCSCPLAFCSSFMLPSAYGLYDLLYVHAILFDIDVITRHTVDYTNRVSAYPDRKRGDGKSASPG